MYFSEAARLKDYKTFQVSTHSDKGGHKDYVSISPNSSYSFPELEGPGAITNIWLTAFPMSKGFPIGGKLGILDKIRTLPRFLDYNKLPKLLNNVYLKIYFEDQKEPFVNAPIGAFFGSGFGEYNQFMSRYIGMTMGGFVSNFYIPFRFKARIEIENKLKNMTLPYFYGSANYIQFNKKKELRDFGYFRADFSESDGNGPYEILNIEGKRGHFLGMVLNAENKKRGRGFSNLEGDLEVFVDDNTRPSLVYTGTEDVFQGGWYYAKNSKSESAKFQGLDHGLSVKTLDRSGILSYGLLSKLLKFKSSQYRFFTETIPFDKSIKCIIHTGENDEIDCKYSSVAYWYQSPIKAVNSS